MEGNITLQTQIFLLRGGRRCTDDKLGALPGIDDAVCNDLEMDSNVLIKFGLVPFSYMRLIVRRTIIHPAPYQIAFRGA